MAVIKNLVVNLIAKTASFEKGMKRGRKELKSFKMAVGEVDRAIVGLAAIAVASGAAILKLGSIASETQEIMSKFDTVFGELSESARTWAEDFGNSVGRAVKDVAGSMASLQDIFVPLGFEREQGFQLSKSLVQLATDVASFNDKADADVLRDFTSALVGSMETVRKYGIVLNTSAIEQEALRKGITKTFQELNDMEKVALRYSLILKGTTDAQGDAIRTGGSYANQVKKMQGAITNLASAMGTEMLPAMTKSVESITRFVNLLSSNDAVLGKNILRIIAYGTAMLAVNKIIKIVVNSIRAVIAAQKVMATTSATAQAVAGGPAAWAKLATGIAFAATAVASLEMSFKKIGNTFDEVNKKQDEFFDISLKGLAGPVMDESLRPIVDEIERLTSRLKMARQEAQRTSGTVAEGMGGAEEEFKGWSGEIVRVEKNLRRLNSVLDRFKEKLRQESLFSDISKGVEDLNAKLREEIELFGMTSNERVFEKLRKAGEQLKGFNKISFESLINDSRLLLRVLTRMEDQANKTKKAIELTDAQKAEKLRTERLRDFAKSVRQSLKSDLTLLKEFRTRLMEAVSIKALSKVEAAEALRRKVADMMGDSAAVPAGGGGGGRGESRAIRTAFVSVAGLTSRSPQVQEQQRTNQLLEKSNRTLTEIAGQELR